MLKNNKQTLGDPALQNIAHAMLESETIQEPITEEGAELKSKNQSEGRIQKKLQIDQTIRSMIQESLRVAGNVVVPVVKQTVGMFQDVAAGVGEAVHASAEALNPSNAQNLLAGEVQAAAQPIPFTQKYPINHPTNGSLPHSEIIDTLVSDYYQLYVLRNLNDYTQVWGPEDGVRLPVEAKVLSLQKDIIDYFFNKIAEESQTAEGTKNLYNEMRALVDNSDGFPEGELQSISRVYLDACVPIYQRHVLNEGLADNARAAKSLDEQSIGELQNEIASIEEREKELTQQRLILTREFTDAVVINTQEMSNNVFERFGISQTLYALGKSKAIYKTLSENETISQKQYEYLRDHEISPKHQHETNLKLLRIARGMIALQPGYDEIERRAKEYLEAFTAQSLRTFVAALQGHIAAISQRIQSQEVDMEKNLPLLKLTMHVLKNLVPELPIVAIQGMIHYDKQDFDLLDVLRGDFNEARPLFKEISEAYNAQIEYFKNISHNFINNTIVLINDDVANYLRAPTEEIAGRIVKRLGLYHEFFSDYHVISKGDRLNNLSEFLIDDFNTADPMMVLNSLINRYKTAVISHVTRIKFGTNNALLDSSVDSLMHLNQAVQNSAFVVQKRALNSAFTEISITAKAKSASAVQRLGMVARHKIIGGLKEALTFNHLFRKNIANKLNIPWESQEKLILKIMGRLGVNSNFDDGITFREGLIEALTESGVSDSLAKLHYHTLPFLNKLSMKSLSLDDHFSADLPSNMTAEMNAVIIRVIDNHPEMEWLDFGRFVPSNEFFSCLLNEYEKINCYFFPKDAESNPQVERLYKNRTVILTLFEDLRNNKMGYYRSRKALLAAHPAVKQPYEDLKIVKEKAAVLKHKAMATYNRLLKTNNQESVRDSASSSSSSASLPMANSVATVDDFYSQFLSALMNDGLIFTRVRKRENFHPFMLKAYYDLSLSLATAVEMFKLALEDNDESAAQWLDILYDNISDLRFYIKSAHEFFMHIEGEVIQSSLETLQKFSDSVLENYAELMPADYVSLIRKLERNLNECRDVLIKLLKAYVLSRDLLNDYNNVEVLDQHSAFITSLLANPLLVDEVLDVLVNQFIFSSSYSAEILRPKYPDFDLRINTALVSHLIRKFTAGEFSQDPVMFGNHLRILMTNPNVASNVSLHAAFVRGLAHYLATYSSDVDFPVQLHAYVGYLQDMRIRLSSEQSVALLTHITAMSKTKWKNSQQDLAALVDLLPNADNVISSPLYQALDRYENMARDYDLNRVVSPLRSDLENEGWVIEEHNFPAQLQSLPQVAQNTYRYFSCKLTPQAEGENLKLHKQLKKLDIMVTMLDGLVAGSAPAEDLTITAKRALVTLGYGSAGNTAIYRFVNSLGASGLLDQPKKITILRDAMKNSLYDVLLKAFIDKYIFKQRALLTIPGAVDLALKDLARLENFLTLIVNRSPNADNFGTTLLARMQEQPQRPFPYRIFTKIATRPKDIDKLFSQLTPLLVENVSVDSVNAILRATLADFKNVLTAKRAEHTTSLRRHLQ